MKTNAIYNEPNLATMAQMPDNFVDCIVTSPPYWGLRDYGHPDQLGLEETPEQYVANMVAVFRECRRVLKETGTLWLNLGDSYNGSGYSNHENTGGAQRENGGKQKHLIASRLKPKDLVGIPWRVAFALQADGWYLRSDIIWHKPNPMPESVTDRPTKSHEYIFLLTKNSRYYYDAEAVKERQIKGHAGSRFDQGKTGVNGAGRVQQGERVDHEGRNRRSVWTIPTKPYSGAHFAVFPPDLIKPCVLAGSPEKVCECCGKPWERVVEREAMEVKYSERKEQMVEYGRTATSGTMTKPPRSKTTGWQPTCACPSSTGSAKGIVYDPFGGSGTTAEVAATYGRQWIISEINPEYVELADERMLPFNQLQMF